MVDSSSSAIVKGASEDDHVVPVIRVVAEMLTLRRQLIGKPPDQALLILLELRSQARALVAGRVLVDPPVKGGPDYQRWVLAKAELAKADDIYKTVRVPEFATPNPRPIRGPWGTTYEFGVAARKSFGSIDAEHVQFILPGRLEREDKKALFGPLLKMHEVVGHLFVALDLLGIVDENTEVALRLSEFTSQHFKRDVASAQGALPASQQEEGRRDDGDDYDEDRYGVIEDV